MFEKAGKFYADWRTSQGTRVRKSFTSRRAALQFEAQQRDLAHPKTQARRTAWPKSSAPATNAPAPANKKPRSPAGSSRQQATSPVAVLVPRTSKK